MASRGGNTDRTLAMGGSGGTARPSMAPQASGGVVKARQLVSVIFSDVTSLSLSSLSPYSTPVQLISWFLLSIDFLDFPFPQTWPNCVGTEVRCWHLIKSKIKESSQHILIMSPL